MAGSDTGAIKSYDSFEAARAAGLRAAGLHPGSVTAAGAHLVVDRPSFAEDRAANDQRVPSRKPFAAARAGPGVFKVPGIHRNMNGSPHISLARKTNLENLANRVSAACAEQSGG